MLDARYSPKLLLGLEDLWRNEIFVDTTLEFGDEEVKVHRAVLAAASDYFKKAITFRCFAQKVMLKSVY